MVQLGANSDFMTFDLDSSTFMINSENANNFKPGIYPIQITLSDEFGAVSKHKIVVHLK